MLKNLANFADLADDAGDTEPSLVTAAAPRSHYVTAPARQLYRLWCSMARIVSIACSPINTNLNVLARVTSPSSAAAMPKYCVPRVTNLCEINPALTSSSYVCWFFYLSAAFIE
ncbi:hypothetical protein EVAR_32050_1 [Eumeta japonica]|uniref:Uncharacterized protein n=1 Tax=Eumeta variegata TaxID=151549 RepID=A0A4C1WQV1_EUMVA|nr:hypothetical protein EVAR_32050_1 [Eumeta japonica]